jgi:hypothetical protein
LKEALEFVREQRQEKEQAASQALLDEVLDHWTRMDKEDNIPENAQTPRAIKLAQIAAISEQGGFDSMEKLAEMARQPVVQWRDALVGSSVTTRGDGTGPPTTVPPGAPPPGQARDFRDEADPLAAATRAAMADLQAGRLPKLQT